MKSSESHVSSHLRLTALTINHQHPASQQCRGYSIITQIHSSHYRSLLMLYILCI